MAAARATAVRAATALAVVAALLTGLMGGGHPVAAQGTIPASGVPAAAQSNVSPFPVLQHLGRWDGTAFQPVTAASIDTGHVVVLAHGWSPGFLAAYQRLQASSATLVTAWTPGLVDGANQSLLDTWVPVARALQLADPGSAVVLYSWVDQSATGDDPLQARQGEDATEVNGHRLATALDQALVPGFAARGGQLHLIGHSFGANVATTAALALREPPRQLTLLDSPETTLAQLGGAKNDLRYKLPRLDIGRGPGQTFVDNYISYVGVPFAGYPGLEQVVDVKTAPPPDDGPGPKHSFAIVWYRTSAEDLAAGVGMAWSPLLGADDAGLGSSYAQTSPSNVLALTAVAGPPAPGVRTQLLLSTTAMKVPGVDQVRTDAPVRATGSTGTAPRGTAPLVAEAPTTAASPPGTAASPPGTAASPPAGASGVALGAGAPTTWNLTFATDETSLWMDFDVVLAGAAGDSLSVFVDGRQRYQAAVPDAGTGRAGSFVILYDVTPGSHVVSATLTGPAAGTAADPQSTATITRLELSSTAGIQRNLTTDETDALVVAALIAVGAVALLVIAFAVYVLVRLRRLARRHRAQAHPD